MITTLANLVIIISKKNCGGIQGKYYIGKEKFFYIQVSEN